MDNRYQGNHTIRGIDFDKYTFKLDPLSDFREPKMYEVYFDPNTDTFKRITHIPKQVIHNGRTTILVWEDKTKTIVKAMQGEKVDKQLGFLIAFFQKHSGLSKTKANEYLEQFIDNKERNCRTCKNLNSVPYKYPCCYCTSNQGFAYWEEI